MSLNQTGLTLSSVIIGYGIVYRFSPDGKEGRNPLCHLPFGWGPRSCIGMRFALMEAKMALVNILKSYKFKRGPDTQVRLHTI